MKKTLALTIILLALIVAPVSATPNEHSEHMWFHLPSLTPTSTPSVTADPTASVSPTIEYKNHGEYVRTVAQMHREGKEVSEAARSEVGKPQHTEDQDKDEKTTLTPTSTPSVSPTETPTATPSTTLTPTATPSGSVTITHAQLQSIISALESLLNSLRSLL